jgi:hypothetical protein
MFHKMIFKCFLICILLSPVLGFAGNTMAQQAPTVFLPEEVFEFQPVLEGTEIIHQFAVLNRGDALLEILKIQSG